MGRDFFAGEWKVQQKGHGTFFKREFRERRKESEKEKESARESATFRMLV